MNSNFHLGALSDWQSVSEGEILSLLTAGGSARTVDFRVLADAPCSVIITDEDNVSRLVAYGSGLMDIKFTIGGVCYLSFGADAATSIFVKTKIAAMVLAESGELTFTDIEPRRMSTSERVTRVQELMARNQNLRLEKLLQGIEEKQRLLDEKMAVVEPVQQIAADAPA